MTRLPRTTYYRRRAIAAGAVAAVIVAAIVAGVSTRGSRTVTVRRTPVHASILTTTLPARLRVPVATTTTVFQFIDRGRPVVRSGTTVAGYRYLPTLVWRPVGTGPWPLVVFVHGFNIEPMAYQRFCSTLAAHGYVVAAPSFPLEDPSRGNGLDRGDLPNEAADVSFVISGLETSSLASVLDPARVAVAGHSDGADVALMVGYQPGRVDRRVKAVVADAPDPMGAGIPQSATPLLLIQGSADEVVPYSASQTVFAQVSAPRWYVTLVGAGHLPPIAGGTPWTAPLDDDVAAFLDTTLHRPVTGEEDLAQVLAQSPLTRVQEGR